MNEFHFLSIAGLLIALIDFFNLSRGVNRYLKQLNKKFAAALVSGVDPNEGGIHFLDVGSLFMLIFITNLVNAVLLFIDVSIDSYSGQGLLHVIAGFLMFLLIAALFSVLCTYVVTIVFGIWQSYMNYYLDFRVQPGLMKAWLILISPLAILFFPLVLFLVLMVVVNYGLVSLLVYLLSLPKKGIVGSLGLLIAISPFFV